MIPLCNMHTHTLFCDGKNTVDEMVESAISLGVKTLGFSGHSPMEGERFFWSMPEENVEKYIAAVKAAKAKYADKIEVVLGMECDSISKRDLSPYEYIIGSVHTVEKNGEYFGVDSEEYITLDIINNQFGGDIYSYVKNYYEEVARLPEKFKFDIVGHFDLVTKYNEGCKHIDIYDKAYQNMALEALDALLPHDYIFEINSGAVAKGYRKTPYPADFILRRMAEKGAKIMINSDTHATSTVMFGYDAALEFARSCGVRSIFVWVDGGFKEFGI